jgi:hypothetical protein
MDGDAIANDGEPHAVWTVADDDVYAVGAARAVLHYDGREWTALPSPTTTSSLIGVWAAADGDVVEVAQDGAVFRLVAGAWQTITPSPQVVLFGNLGHGDQRSLRRRRDGIDSSLRRHDVDADDIQHGAYAQRGVGCDR